jgi:hypothetical protein
VLYDRPKVGGRNIGGVDFKSAAEGLFLTALKRFLTPFPRMVAPGLRLTREIDHDGTPDNLPKRIASLGCLGLLNPSCDRVIRFAPPFTDQG